MKTNITFPFLESLRSETSQKGYRKCSCAGTQINNKGVDQ